MLATATLAKLIDRADAFDVGSHDLTSVSPRELIAPPGFILGVQQLCLPTCREGEGSALSFFFGVFLGRVMVLL